MNFKFKLKTENDQPDDKLYIFSYGNSLEGQNTFRKKRTETMVSITEDL